MMTMFNKMGDLRVPAAAAGVAEIKPEKQL
jgi:hypothetical protein